VYSSHQKSLFISSNLFIKLSISKIMESGKEIDNLMNKFEEIKSYSWWLPYTGWLG